jgi:hypothetical protein
VRLDFRGFEALVLALSDGLSQNVGEGVSDMDSLAYSEYFEKEGATSCTFQYTCAVQYFQR